MNKANEPKAAQAIFDRHYTSEELAKLWGLDESTVRRLFHKSRAVRIPHRRRGSKSPADHTGDS